MEKILRRVLVRDAPAPTGGDRITNAEAIMVRKVDLARAGNLIAIQAIEDRIDGRPTQKVEASMRLDIHAILDQIPTHKLIEAAMAPILEEEANA